MGYTGVCPGTLEFFDEEGMRILRLELRKHQGLYYCEVGRVKDGGRNSTGYNMIPGEWIGKTSAMIEDDMVNVWVKALEAKRIAAKV